MQYDKAEHTSATRTTLARMRELGLLGIRLLGTIGRIVIILVLVLLSYPVLEVIIEYCRSHSDAYQVATRFAVNNSDVFQVIGPVLKVRLDNKFNFHFCGSQADYTLDLTSEKANATLQIQVKYIADSWVVTEAALSTADHTTLAIRQTTTDWGSDSTSAGLYPFLWKKACYATSFPPMLSGTFG